jgi:hypothetical protein
MAAPEHVPTPATQQVRTYTSPPRRDDPWMANRPADFADQHRQPDGDRLGRQGPDQGYALKLARAFAGTLTLRSGEHETDAIAGAVAIGLKRASQFGRAPVIHDIRAGLVIWGFLDANPDLELVKLRTKLFEEVSHPHHYAELRGIVDMVTDDVLRQTPDEIRAAHDSDWKKLIAS